MTQFNTAVVSASNDIEARLADFGLVRGQLIEIGKTARLHANDASHSMPANAAGLLSYIHGVGELRQQLVGREYASNRTCGVEAVIRRDYSLRIGFQNVDKCCVDMPPIPRSEKGNGAAGLSATSLFEYAGVEEGPLKGIVRDEIRTYYVMVGLDGSVELSCPAIENGKYVNWYERIFIYSPNGEWDVKQDTEEDTIEDFEINISFKEE